MHLSTKNIIVAVLISGSLLVITGSCERDVPSKLGTVDCAECYQDKPEWGRLNVTLTINNENPYVPLVIYIARRLFSFSN